MAIELKMPALSPTMEEGTLAKWLVKEGDHVKSGDILAEIETDKATMEFEAVDEGVISSINVAAGTDGVKVGTVIALITGEGEEAAAPSPKPVVSVPDEIPEQSAPAANASNLMPTDSDAVAANGAMQTVTLREALRDAMALLPYALAVAAASLLYVAVADLIPGLHRRTDPRASAAQIVWIGAGIALVAFAESMVH